VSERPLLYLSDADVRRLLTPAAAVDCAERALRCQADGRVAWSEPRLLTVTPAGRTLKYAAKACVLDEEYAGFRVAMVDRAVRAADASPGGGPRQLTLLCDAAAGRLLAVIDEEWQHAVRTIAAAAVAVRYCAIPGPQIVALVGAGRVAAPALAALQAVVEVAELRIASRSAATREALVHELGAPARAVSDVEQAVRGATVVITATTSPDPVVLADWVRPGAFIYAAGDGQELDTELYRRADRVMADDWQQCQLRPDIVRLVGDGVIDPESVTSLWEVVGGLAEGRRSAADVVAMRSQGLVSQDVAVAAHVYERALEAGVGVRLEG
jgi:ornithine cyclodeaminase/alanine dehydrogenase-like protein (mu-crystallin family)